MREIKSIAHLHELLTKINLVYAEVQIYISKASDKPVLGLSQPPLCSPPSQAAGRCCDRVDVTPLYPPSCPQSPATKVSSPPQLVHQIPPPHFLHVGFWSHSGIFL